MTSLSVTIICDEKGLGIKLRSLGLCQITHSAKSLKLISP